MYHYKARAYSPTLGRFMQTDPVGYDDQFNLYAYVGDDPVNQTDPSGNQRAIPIPIPIPVPAPCPGCDNLTGELAQRTQVALGALGRVLGLTRTAEDRLQPLYRALSTQDVRNISQGRGIIATNPNANISINDHVSGVKPSQYISTTTNLSVAQSYAGVGGVAVITRGEAGFETDLTRGSLNLGIVGNYKAIRDSEVLIERSIPPQAIERIIPTLPTCPRASCQR